MTTTFTTYATATFATGNIVVVLSADNMISGLPITFSGNTFGNIQANTTYYIGNITFGYPTSNITLTGLPGGGVVPIGNGSGNMTATFNQGGQIIIPTVAPGEPLNQAFDAINTNFDQIFAAGPVGSNIKIVENTIYTLNTNGNLVLNPNGIGNVVANAHVVPDRDRVRNLGAPLLRWNTVYAQQIVGNITGNIVAGGSNGQIQYNRNGVLAGANGFVYAANTDSVSLTGTLTSGNILTPGTVSSAGGIYGDLYTTLIDSGDSSAILVLAEVNMLSDLSVGQSLQVNQNISATGNVTGSFFIGNGSQLTGVTATATNVNANTLLGNTLSGNVIFSSLTTLGNLVALTVIGNTTTGNLGTAGSVSATGNITGNYFFGNGSQLTGIAASSVNANALTGNTLSANVVFSNLTTVGTLAQLSVAGNITGNYFIGDGSQLTNLPAGDYSNANVAAYLPTYTGTITANIVSATGNVTANFFIGDGSQLTNLPAGDYSNANVAAYLPTYTGNLAANVISATGNITGNYFFGNGSQLTGIAAASVDANALTGNTLSSNVVFSNLTTVGTLTDLSVTGTATTGNVLTSGLVSAAGNVRGGNINTAGLITAAGNVHGGNILTGGAVSAGGNITGNYFIGDGSQLTNLPAGNYSNANVAAYLPTYTGNITADIISATGNVTANFFIGDGSQLTGITAGNVDANALTGNTLSSNVVFSSLTSLGVLTDLSVTGTATTGNVLTGGEVSAAGNITGNYFIGDGSQLTNLPSGNYSNANVAAYLPTYTGNITADIISATGNITGNYFFGNGSQLTGIAAASVDANALTGNTLSSNVIFSSLTTVGTLTDLSVTGNTTTGNLVTGGLISAAGNVTSANVNTGNILTTGNVSVAGTVYTDAVAGNTALTLSTVNGAITLSPTGGNVSVNNNYITNLLDPENPQDAATKQYVDDVAQGLTVMDAVAAATSGNLDSATGGTVSYNNGTAGVGANLVTTGTYVNIDGVAINTANTRILVKNEANAAWNGVYVYSNSTVITRATDFDTVPEVGPGDYFFVQFGSTNGNTSWVQTANVTTIGTSNIVFTQFSGAAQYTANTSAGLQLTGTVFSAKVDGSGLNTIAFDGNGNLYIPPGANLTTPNIGAATGTSLSVTGNITSNTFVTGNKIIPATGNVNVANVNINNVVDPVQAQDAATKAYVDNNLANVSANVLGNLINMGSNTQGQLVSNAVTLTTTTKVTDGIALLNQVLGKLVPPAPPAFPAGQTLSITGVSTYRMANITQVNNTANSLTVAAGATVTRVRRASTYSTNTITTAGPGDAGTITSFRNGTAVGNTTFNAAATPSANGTYGGNLVITNNMDYNSANSSIAAGFWYVFSAAISGSGAPAGWNDMVITQSAAGTSNVVNWYYDLSSPGSPSFTSTAMAVAANTVTFSSTIPHYTSATQFNIGATVANASGNMYPTSNVLASGTAGGSFAAPVTVNYNQSNIGSNILNAFQTAIFTTTANVTTGFGGSNVGPSMTVDNSYTTGTLTLTSALGNIVLRKTGNTTAIDEGNIVITSVGTGSGSGVRIVNPGAGNTPAYTANATVFNSQSSTLQTNDATVVGSGSQGVLRHDQTNYSVGYLPVGPNLSTGRSGTQYFTFKFVRTDVSKFDITYAGNVAGMWVALPGSVIDSSSSANGWINMAVAYAGAGYPGVNAPGNGSDGCALGGVVQLNTTVASTSRTCTFGTVSSSSTATNEIYVRIALTSGQSVTGLSLKAASN